MQGIIDELKNLVDPPENLERTEHEPKLGRSSVQATTSKLKKSLTHKLQGNKMAT